MRQDVKQPESEVSGMQLIIAATAYVVGYLLAIVILRLFDYRVRCIKVTHENETKPERR